MIKYLPNEDVFLAICDGCNDEIIIDRYDILEDTLVSKEWWTFLSSNGEYHYCKSCMEGFNHIERRFE